MLHLHHRRRRVVVRHRKALDSGLSRQGWRCKKSGGVDWARTVSTRPRKMLKAGEWTCRLRATVVVMAQWLGFRRVSRRA